LGRESAGSRDSARESGSSLGASFRDSASVTVSDGWGEVSPALKAEPLAMVPPSPDRPYGDAPGEYF